LENNKTSKKLLNWLLFGAAFILLGCFFYALSGPTPPVSDAQFNQMVQDGLTYVSSSLNINYYILLYGSYALFGSGIFCLAVTAYKFFKTGMSTNYGSNSGK
jgi:hypothetical protein